MSTVTDEIDGVRPSRRTVIRGAVWTVPVIAAAAAAPAYAASPPCKPVSFNFNDFPAGTSVPSGTSTTIGGVSVRLDISGPSAGTANNSKIFATTSSSNELRFYDANRSSTSQTIALTFGEPVTNLQLTIVDIDRASSYDDRVVVTTGGFSYARGADVIGAGTGSGGGTNSGPFRSRTGNAVADGQAAAMLTLTWAAAVSFVSFDYLQGPGTITGNPHIGLRALTFTPSSC